MIYGNLSVHASLNFFCSTSKRSEMRVNSTFDPGWTSHWFWSEDWQERHHWPAKAWWQDCPAGQQDCLPCCPDCLLLARQIAAISPPPIPSQSIHPAPSTSRILGPWITSYSGPLHFPLNISSFARDICSGNDFEAINLYFYRHRKKGDNSHHQLAHMHWIVRNSWEMLPRVQAVIIVNISVLRTLAAAQHTFVRNGWNIWE